MRESSVRATRPHKKEPAAPRPDKPWPTESAGSFRQATPPPKKGGPNTVLIILISLGVLALVSLMLTSFISGLGTTSPGSVSVAVIPVEGTIMPDQMGGLFAMDVADAPRLVKDIEHADKDSGIDAIVLQINSPGGSAVASEEVTRAVAETSKHTVAIIGDQGTSGAYWVASAADWVIANRMSITGSVGVLGSHLEFAGLLERYNVTYRRLVSGDQKDIGTPYRQMTDEEIALIQDKLDMIHQYFLEDVAANRGLDASEINELSTGIFFLGEEAIDLKLVDELGGKKELEAHLMEELGAVKINYIDYRRTPGLLESLGSLAQSFNPRIDPATGPLMLR